MNDTTAVAAPPKSKFVGKSVKRKEDYDVLVGKERYTADFKLPNMLYAAIYRSPYAHAKIVDVDLRKALELPGVVMGLTAKDIPAHVKPMPPFPFQSRDPFRKGNPTIKFFNHHCLAKDKVRFVGEAVAVVVAVNRYVAEDAIELITAEYEPCVPITDAEAALENTEHLLYEEWGDNLMLKFKVTGGDVDGAFRQADLVVKERIKSSRFTGTPIEPRAITAHKDPETDLLTVVDSTQIPHNLSTLIAETLNLPNITVRVIAPRVGGGFGQKWDFYPEEVLIPLLCLLTERPIQWVETRSEHMKATHHARDQVHYIEIAVKKDGTVLAVKDKIIADLGAAYPNGGLASIVTTTMFVPGAYKIRNYQGEVCGVVTNKTSYGAHRGFGKSEAAYVIERAMDIVANRLNMDPAEVRFKNFIQPGEFPYISVTGTRYDSGNYPEALRRALELANYQQLRQQQATSRNEGRYLGIGMSLVIEPSSSTRMGSYNPGYYSLTLRMDPTGKVYVFTGGNDEGQGHKTTIAQLVADEVGVGLDDIYVLEGDSLECPYGSGSYSSRFAVVGSSAAILAGRQLRDKILRIASGLLKEPQESLEISDGRVYSTLRPEHSLSIVEVAKTAYFAIYLLPEGMEPGLQLTYHYRDPNITFHADERGRVAMFSSVPYDANLAVVEVDLETGQLKILKYISVHDCGSLINPAIVEGQHIGALVHGLGGALYEEILYDKNGQLLTENFKDYIVPTAMEVPVFTLDHLITPNPFTPYGSKGAGETGTVGPPAALANALEDALRPLGKKIRTLPLSPNYIWSTACGEAT
ncbi:MAG: xanthine dehydrogenase family protein molybdopterin-binding subunit [Acidobacteria bacterium]|nr:xanthine dehydrogenase family protein molybdopterin-binding subunit [Acidobacteriota bacterium]